MRSVHHCKSCGFVSTIGSEFSRKESVLFCKDCLASEATDQDVGRWIGQALAAASSTVAASPDAGGGLQQEMTR